MRVADYVLFNYMFYLIIFWRDKRLVPVLFVFLSQAATKIQIVKVNTFSIFNNTLWLSGFCLG